MAFLSLLRKWRRCWSFFMVEQVFRDLVMFLARWTPRNEEQWMSSGSWSLCDLRKSTTISLVLSKFRDRLLILHQVISCSNSSLYDDSSFLSMRPTVPLPNLMMWFDLCSAVQSWVRSVTHQKVQDPVAEGCVQAQQAQLPSQVLGDDCVEC